MHMENYPNLERLAYQIMSRLSANEDFKKKLVTPERCQFEITIFSQIWGNTCTGFDICEDGSAAFGGDAMTKEYTVIFHELSTDTYVICFGNRPCYMVTDPTKEFYADLKARNMASLSEAKKKY